MRCPNFKTPIPDDTDCEVVLFERSRCRSPGHAMITVPGSRLFWVCAECLAALRKDGLRVTVHEERKVNGG